jgi:hypothetical protein
MQKACEEATGRLHGVDAQLFWNIVLRWPQDKKKRENLWHYYCEEIEELRENIRYLSVYANIICFPRSGMGYMTVGLRSWGKYHVF